ncbi:MAG: L,D-transpeptidase family protein [Chloroflexi bacterium]|nr:L,D-transpeptidase family protein [Chloroflexota bacterium]
MIGTIFAITVSALLMPFQLQPDIPQSPIPPTGTISYLPEIGLGDEQYIPVSGDAQETGAQEQVYLVRPGESLSVIARRFGTTVGQLMYANPGIRNPNLIYPGQALIIPNSSDIVDENAWREQRLQDAAASASEQIIGEGGSYQPASSDEHWVLIDLASQTLHAYEGTTVVRSFLVSTGTWQYPTVTGTFKIWIKLQTDDMRGPGYDLKDVPYVMYFYKGYGLHGTYWHNNFGTPMSHGCVNLATEDAEWLFSFLDVGSVVSVR